MSQAKITVSSMAMDLKRVAVSYWQGSEKTALRFVEESLKRRDELESADLKPYFKKLMKNLPKVLAQKDKKRLAEDALMYSTICQNYALKFLE